MSRSLFFILAIAAASSGGCAPRSLYDWGSYENSIARQYDTTEEFQIEHEIRILTDELQRTRPERIPPGKAAYVGYLLAQKGDLSASKQFFVMEKRLFPESTTYIDQILKRPSFDQGALTPPTSGSPQRKQTRKKR